MCFHLSYHTDNLMSRVGLRDTMVIDLTGDRGTVQTLTETKIMCTAQEKASLSGFHSIPSWSHSSVSVCRFHSRMFTNGIGRGHRSDESACDVVSISSLSGPLSVLLLAGVSWEDSGVREQHRLPATSALLAGVAPVPTPPPSRPHAATTTPQEP